MDFVPIAYTRGQRRRTLKSIFTRIGVGAATTSPVPVLVAVGAPGEAIFTAIMTGTFGILLALVSTVVVPDEQKALRSRDRSDSIRSSINEHYGLSLSADQFEALSYPNSDPGAEFQTYGSVKIQDQVEGVNFVERTIYLTAANGELKLSESRDGKRFKELKPDRHALEAAASRDTLSASV